MLTKAKNLITVVVVSSLQTDFEKRQTLKRIWQLAFQSHSSEKLQILSLNQSWFDIRKFLKFSYLVYEKDPNWVAPLLLDSYMVLSSKNPFFNHAKIQLWMAYRDKKPIGRIAAILDEHHNIYHNDRAVFFGFFECLPDPEVASKLFDRVCQWAKLCGMKRVIGPMNPNTNEVCGLLIDGFDSRPIFMMPYNPQYYPELIERAGFQKLKDLLAYRIELNEGLLQRLDRIAAICRHRHPGLTFRHVDRSQIDQELKLIMAIYNTAWEDNWGFVPMTHEEIGFLAKRLKPIFQEQFVWLALDGNQPVGFLLGMPDLNEPFYMLKGRLFTPAILKALPYFLGKKHPKAGRVLTLGIRREWRNRGIESVLLSETLKRALPLGYKYAEASWILEDNWPMRKILESFGANLYKTYRLYVKELA